MKYDSSHKNFFLLKREELCAKSLFFSFSEKMAAFYLYLKI